MNTELIERIKQRLKEMGETSYSISLKASGGTSKAWIQNIFLGRTINPRADTLAKLAAAMGVSVSWLVSGNTEMKLPALIKQNMPTRKNTPISFPSVPLIGTVSAGSWREADAEDARPREPFPFPPDPRYPHEAQFVVQVAGESMNRVVQPGDYLLCVRQERLHHDPRDGDVVVVETVREHSQLVETTAKRWRKRGALVELRADSSDPRWQNVAFVIDPKGPNHVRVLGTALQRLTLLDTAP